MKIISEYGCHGSLARQIYIQHKAQEMIRLEMVLSWLHDSICALEKVHQTTTCHGQLDADCLVLNSDGKLRLRLEINREDRTHESLLSTIPPELESKKHKDNHFEKKDFQKEGDVYCLGQMFYDLCTVHNKKVDEEVIKFCPG